MRMGVRVRQKNGVWWVFIHHDGRRTSKKVGDKKAAEVVAAKIQAKLVLGDFKIEESASAKPVTFQAAAEQWLESYAKVKCRQSTYEAYRRMLRTYAFPRFGMMPFSEVSPQDLKGMAAEMRAKGLKMGSIKLAVAPIREIYSHAVDDGATLTNPAGRMGRFLKDKTDRRLQIVPLTAEDVQRLLDAAATHDKEREGSRSRDVFPSVHLLMLLAVRSGLRLGECLGLAWENLDVHGRVIEVRGQWTRWGYGPTKSGDLRRVDMSSQLSEALQQALDARMVELAEQGKDVNPTEPIFRNGAGCHLDPSRVSKTILRRCLDRAGLRRIRFHDLRHTFASLLLANGESLVYVKEQMGHESIKVTVDIYGYLVPGANKAAVDKLDAAPDRTPRAPTRRVVVPDRLETPETKAVRGVRGSNPPNYVLSSSRGTCFRLALPASRPLRDGRAEARGG
jgi:integrase